MFNIEQIYTGCLSQGAYYVTSNGEAAIIDPLREVQQYVDKLAKDGVILKYIFETHFHADFVSGHVTLSEKTGAPIVFGPTANTSFDAIIATDEQTFKVGDITIKVLHTPGHTMESTTYLLIDEEGKEHAIFSGDTLFLGDVGRPDLAQKAAEITKEDLAGMLFESLRTKILPLPDSLIVYPAHGAGSACGKNMMKETVDTLGNQRKVNYALRSDMTKDEFVKELTDGLLPPPAYFPLNVKLNKEGYQDIANVISKGTRPLDPAAFQLEAEMHNALILDVRPPQVFAKAFIPRSINIGINGTFAPWVGALVKDITVPILLVTPEGREEEVVTRLSRVGFDNALGYLNGGVEAWIKEGKEIDEIESISATEFESRFDDSLPLFDVRRETEYLSEHLLSAKNIPLSNLNDHLAMLPKEQTFYIHCAGGYRSMIAASILKSRGYHNIIDIAGGYGSLSKTNIKASDFVCPTTL